MSPAYKKTKEQLSDIYRFANVIHVKCLTEDLPNIVKPYWEDRGNDGHEKYIMDMIDKLIKHKNDTITQLQNTINHQNAEYIRLKNMEETLAPIQQNYNRQQAIIDSQAVNIKLLQQHNTKLSSNKDSAERYVQDLIEDNREMRRQNQELTDKIQGLADDINHHKKRFESMHEDKTILALQLKNIYGKH